MARRVLRDPSRVAGVTQFTLLVCAGTTAVHVIAALAALVVPGATAYVVTDTVELARAGTFAVAGVAVMVWTFRVHSNAHVFHPRRPAHGRWLGWAGWLIPVVGWFVPVQIVRQSFRFGGPQRSPLDVPRIRWWWGLFLVGTMAAGASAQISGSVEGLLLMRALSGGVLVAAAVLCVSVVRSVTARQMGAIAEVRGDAVAVPTAAEVASPSAVL